MGPLRVEPDLLNRMQSEPGADFDLLIRVERADAAVERLLESAGITVRRRIRLVPTFAITSSGAVALSLLAHDWVYWIEEDRQVHTAGLPV